MLEIVLIIVNVVMMVMMFSSYDFLFFFSIRISGVRGLGYKRNIYDLII
jgi:hypothetical protein